MEAQQQPLDAARTTRAEPLSWGEQYGDCFKSGDWSDATLQLTSDTGERSFKVHKWILRFASEYFQTLFFGSMTDSNLQHFPIVEPCSDVFETFLELLYRRQVKIESPAVGVELYVLADKYISPEAFAYCSQYLIDALNVDNAIKLYALAKRHHDKKLKAASRNVWSQHTQVILTNGSLDAIDMETVSELFRVEPLNIDSELDLFNAVAANKKWCLGDSMALLNVLQKIRYLTIDLDSFLAVVVKSRLLNAEICCAIICNLKCNSSGMPMPAGFNSSRICRLVNNKVYRFNIQSSLTESPKNTISISLNENLYLHEVDVFNSYTLSSGGCYNNITTNITIKSYNDNQTFFNGSVTNNLTSIRLPQPILFLKNTKYLIIANNAKPSEISKNGFFIVQNNIELKVFSAGNTRFSSMTFKKTNVQ